VGSGRNAMKICMAQIFRIAINFALIELRTWFLWRWKELSELYNQVFHEKNAHSFA